MKIGFSKTFTVHGGFEKSWIEDDELTHGLNLFDCTDEQIAELMLKIRRIQYKLRTQVIENHYESIGADKKKEEQVSDSVQATLDGIENSKDMDELNSYWAISKSNMKLSAAFNKKKDELNTKG